MLHKAGSRLPELRMNLQDFSGLTNEILDWTDQSDKSLLCSRVHEKADHLSLSKPRDKIKRWLRESKILPVRPCNPNNGQKVSFPLVL